MCLVGKQQQCSAGGAGHINRVAGMDLFLMSLISVNLLTYDGKGHSLTTLRINWNSHRLYGLCYLTNLFVTVCHFWLTDLKPRPNYQAGLLKKSEWNGIHEQTKKKNSIHNKMQSVLQSEPNAAAIYLQSMGHFYHTKFIHWNWVLFRWISMYHKKLFCF